ncbi:MAG: hypothetical protein GY742_05640 [Hyphomicrobiales bacterium]|nr:hypothetical protein [Hyphomicrobiales bacterium]
MPKPGSRIQKTIKPKIEDVEFGGGDELEAPNPAPNNKVIEFVAIDRLKMPRRPLRKGIEKRIQKHVLFQDEHGFHIPVSTDENFEIIADEERVEAARRRGQTHIHVIRHFDCTSVQKKALRLFEVKIAGDGELDVEKQTFG